VTAHMLKSGDCSVNVDAETSSMMHKDTSAADAADADAADAHDARMFTCLWSICCQYYQYCMFLSWSFCEICLDLVYVNTKF